MTFVVGDAFGDSPHHLNLSLSKTLVFLPTLVRVPDDPFSILRPRLVLTRSMRIHVEFRIAGNKLSYRLDLGSHGSSTR